MLNVSVEGVPGAGKTAVLRRLKELVDTADNFPTTVVVEHTLMNADHNDDDPSALLLRHVEMLLPYAELPGALSTAICICICERSPQSLHRVYLSASDMDPIRYNLYKQVLLEGVTWRPSLIFYLGSNTNGNNKHGNVANGDDSATTGTTTDVHLIKERYDYLLRHIKGCEVVHVPSELVDVEGIATYILRTLRKCYDATNASTTATSECSTKAPCASNVALS